MATVKSSFAQKLKAARDILFHQGPLVLTKKLVNAFWYTAYQKRQFVYFEFSVQRQQIYSLPDLVSITVRRASINDRQQIERELFPKLIGEQEYNKRYFSLLGQKGVECFVAEKGGKIVHYSWVFLDARSSPLKDTLFPFQNIQTDDVYIGPVFTDPAERGAGIYSYVLMMILRHLKESIQKKRVLLVVYGKNLAGTDFYRRLGFREIR